MTFFIYRSNIVCFCLRFDWVCFSRGWQPKSTVWCVRTQSIHKIAVVQQCKSPWRSCKRCTRTLITRPLELQFNFPTANWRSLVWLQFLCCLLFCSTEFCLCCSECLHLQIVSTLNSITCNGETILVTLPGVVASVALVFTCCSCLLCISFGCSVWADFDRRLRRSDRHDRYWFVHFLTLILFEANNCV